MQDCGYIIDSQIINGPKACAWGAPRLNYPFAPPWPTALEGSRHLYDCGGAWPSGKARDFGSRIRRFESFRPNQPLTVGLSLGAWIHATQRCDEL